MSGPYEDEPGTGVAPVVSDEPGSGDAPVQEPASQARVAGPRDPNTRDRGDISADDTDVGWGERADDNSRDEWYRRERPPHHGG